MDLFERTYVRNLKSCDVGGSLFNREDTAGEWRHNGLRWKGQGPR